MSLMESPLLFFPLATFIIFMGVGVLTSRSPIMSALSLVLSMVGLGFLFMAMGAYFLGGVQLAVYAGAVTVLFLMVLMLFDLKKEDLKEVKSSANTILKLVTVALFLGLIMGVLSVTNYYGKPAASIDPSSMDTTRIISISLFRDYLFAFEILGVLLLVIAIGVVAVSRIKGGTHDGN